MWSQIVKTPVYRLVHNTCGTILSVDHQYDRQTDGHSYDSKRVRVTTRANNVSLLLSVDLTETPTHTVKTTPLSAETGQAGLTLTEGKTRGVRRGMMEYQNIPLAEV